MLQPVLIYYLHNLVQNLGSQPEPTNQDSQVSDSSQIHGMTLKYSDDDDETINS